MGHVRAQAPTEGLGKGLGVCQGGLDLSVDVVLGVVNALVEGDAPEITETVQGQRRQRRRVERRRNKCGRPPVQTAPEQPMCSRVIAREVTSHLAQARGPGGGGREGEGGG